MIVVFNTADKEEWHHFLLNLFLPFEATITFFSHLSSLLNYWMFHTCWASIKDMVRQFNILHCSLKMAFHHLIYVFKKSFIQLFHFLVKWTKIEWQTNIRANVVSFLSDFICYNGKFEWNNSEILDKFWKSWHIKKTPFFMRNLSLIQRKKW